MAKLDANHQQLRDQLTMAMLTSMSASIAQHSKKNDSKLDSLHADMKSNMDKLNNALQELSIAEAKYRVGEEAENNLLPVAAVSTCPQGNDLLLKPTPKQESFLSMLRFRQMTHRYQGISPAFRKTFQWIFKNPTGPIEWSNFVEYLTESQFCLDGSHLPYWINGKAGSGKSTLMKYIVNQPETKEALEIWAAPHKLLVCSYFPWNVGTDLQKSYAGLLRSLLYQILEACPGYTQDAFPELWRYWRAEDEKTAPALVELKDAFDRLIKKCSTEFRICCFVDGIDEFDESDASYEEISWFFRQLCTSNFKVVASSRPISTCVSIFHNSPKLRLQALTQKCIRRYVNENLCKNQKMLDLQTSSSDASMLVKEIEHKASGVFLWVILVVKLLVSGLEEGDRVEELLQKLRSLPEDLRDLYQRMMSKMKPSHQADGARIFQLLREWNSAKSDQPLFIMDLTVTLWPKPLWQETILRKACIVSWPSCLRRTQDRVRSRCCGLVEIHAESATTVDELSKDSTVEYLHRTVAEFLYEEGIWKVLCDKTKGEQFYPASAFVQNALFKILVTIGTHKFPSSDRRWSLLKEFIVFYGRSNKHALRIELDCMDVIMKTAYSRSLGEAAAVHWSSTFSFQRKEPPRHDGHVIRPLRNVNHNVFTFAARVGFWKYLDRRAQSGDCKRIQSITPSLLVCALQSWVDEWRPPLHLRIETLNYLLDVGQISGMHANKMHCWASVVSVAEALLRASKSVEAGKLLSVFLLDRNTPALSINPPARVNLIQVATKLADFHKEVKHSNPDHDLEAEQARNFGSRILAKLSHLEDSEQPGMRNQPLSSTVQLSLLKVDDDAFYGQAMSPRSASPARSVKRPLDSMDQSRSSSRKLRRCHSESAAPA